MHENIFVTLLIIAKKKHRAGGLEGVIASRVQWDTPVSPSHLQLADVHKATKKCPCQTHQDARRSQLSAHPRWVDWNTEDGVLGDSRAHNPKELSISRGDRTQPSLLTEWSPRLRVTGSSSGTWDPRPFSYGEAPTILAPAPPIVGRGGLGVGEPTNLETPRTWQKCLRDPSCPALSDASQEVLLRVEEPAIQGSSGLTLHWHW